MLCLKRWKRTRYLQRRVIPRRIWLDHSFIVVSLHRYTFFLFVFHIMSGTLPRVSLHRHDPANWRIIRRHFQTCFRQTATLTCRQRGRWVLVPYLKRWSNFWRGNGSKGVNFWWTRRNTSTVSFGCKMLTFFFNALMTIIRFALQLRHCWRVYTNWRQRTWRWKNAWIHLFKGEIIY